MDQENSSTPNACEKTSIPLQPYSSICIVGPTNSGKSHFTKRLIYEREKMYEREPPKKVLYCYGVYQPLYAEMERDMGDSICFHEGLPSESYLDQYAGSEHCLVVIDDLMERALDSPLVENIFVQGCHHKGLSAVFISQNLYKQGSKARTISLNSTYLCLFRNLRDQMQIKTLSVQLGRGAMFVEAYNDATKEPYGYLFCDFSPHTDDETRFRSNIFPGEDTVVYVPK